MQGTGPAMELAVLNKQALEMDRKTRALQSQLAELSRRYGRSAQELGISDANSRKLERKAKIAEKKLKQKPRTSNAKIAALKAQLTNFSTYVPFDYEAEKERVLKMFDE
jgi:seryl-tRNA synthetase